MHAQGVREELQQQWSSGWMPRAEQVLPKRSEDRLAPEVILSINLFPRVRSRLGIHQDCNVRIS